MAQEDHHSSRPFLFPPNDRESDVIVLPNLNYKLKEFFLHIIGVSDDRSPRNVKARSPLSFRVEMNEYLPKTCIVVETFKQLAAINIEFTFKFRGFFENAIGLICPQYDWQ